MSSPQYIHMLPMLVQQGNASRQCDRKPSPLIAIRRPGSILKIITVYDSTRQVIKVVVEPVQVLPDELANQIPSCAQSFPFEIRSSLPRLTSPLFVRSRRIHLYQSSGARMGNGVRCAL
jgi:hypothetical protein